jgi:hypothetical protein
MADQLNLPDEIRTILGSAATAGNLAVLERYFAARVRAEAVAERDAHWRQRLDDVRTELERPIRHERKLRGELLRTLWRAVHDRHDAPDAALISEDQLICAVQDMHREGQCSEAEAVAAERQRLLQIRELAESGRRLVPHAPYTGVSWGALLEILDGPAAGSVPVATPGPPDPQCAECSHGRSLHHKRDGNDDLRWNCLVNMCDCEAFRPGPLATSTEPAADFGSKLAAQSRTVMDARNRCTDSPVPAEQPEPDEFTRTLDRLHREAAAAADPMLPPVGLAAEQPEER